MRISLLLLLSMALASRGAPVNTKVTFNKEIAPIIYHNCSSCHRPGEAAPFPLLCYQNVTKKAKTIGEVTASRQMPPWKPEPASYSYRDERRLAQREIDLIQAWLKDGMPEGNPAEAPEAPKFAS